MPALRPLRPTRADQQRFVDRARETRELLAAADGGRNALVLGAYGSGKSSLLAHAAYERRDAPRRWVIVPGETAATPAALLLRILTGLDQAAAERWEARLSTRARSADPLLEPALIAQLLDELDERARETVLAIDGVAPGVAHALFGSARNEVWALGDTTWVVAGRLEERDLLLRPPADAFFEATIALDPLADDDARALLEAAGEDPSDAVLRAGAGIPAQLLRAAALAREGKAPARLAAAAAPASGTRAGLLGWLVARGSASPSDPDLLEQLGVSRQRAAKLLAELADQGVVRATEERPEGTGRPRKRYTLTA
ncbi:MAG TPA: AAA family ATPase [Solirubrobacteraceae bacterium]|nr:AAA family ATPase [Solirubrobacteraceae bacterium]